MTYREAEAVIDRLTYKPGYRLKISRTTDVYVIRLLMPPLWSVTDGKKIDLVFERALTPLELTHYDQAELVRWIANVIIYEWERHEADEWLKFEGKQLRNPHAGEGKGGTHGRTV